LRFDAKFDEAVAARCATHGLLGLTSCDFGDPAPLDRVMLADISNLLHVLPIRSSWPIDRVRPGSPEDLQPIAARLPCSPAPTCILLVEASSSKIVCLAWCSSVSLAAVPCLPAVAATVARGALRYACLLSIVSLAAVAYLPVLAASLPRGAGRCTCLPGRYAGSLAAVRRCRPPSILGTPAFAAAAGGLDGDHFFATLHTAAFVTVSSPTPSAFLGKALG
jgi:hypothetical protein